MTNILVVGGTSGIGAAVISEYARTEGAKVAMLSRTVPADDSELSYWGRIDVQDLSSVDKAFQEIDAGFGPIDIAVNCVGVWNFAQVADITDADLLSMTAINLTGTIAIIREEAARMATRGSGSIVTLTSAIGATATGIGLGVYAATKAGVQAFTKSVALELAPRGVRLNCVAPGPVRTEMTRLPGEADTAREERLGGLTASGRMASPEEIAASITWLASGNASYINGIELVANGGGFGQ
jgi:3-oxoacyl-[acyl-carrier protein] reductase